MKSSNSSKFRRIILVNWLDLPYAQIDLDENVTIFEGGNGSGKSSVLLAALLALMPDKNQLRSRKVTIERNVEEAVFHRLEPEEPIAYAALEIQLGDEMVLAGVHVTKQKESKSITLDPFIVRRWPHQQSVQDFFRFTAADREWTCDLNDLKQKAGAWGVNFRAPPTLIAYFKELYDLGILPLTMATDAERSQYAHLLETSMAGGLSSALVDRLKNYLLPEYEKLPEATKLMHDNLRSCIETQNELSTCNEQYGRIGALFGALNTYIIALGTRIRREKDAANEALRLTESSLEATLNSLVRLAQEKAALLAEKEMLDVAKSTRVSDLQRFLATKQEEEQNLRHQVEALTRGRQTLSAQTQPLILARDELEKALIGWQEIFPERIQDFTGKELQASIQTEQDRIRDEISQLADVQRKRETEFSVLGLLGVVWVIFLLGRAFQALLTGEKWVFAFAEIGYDYGMGKTLRGRQLRDAYRFTGFVPAAIVRGAFGDPLARVLTLRRRQKKQPVGFVGCGTAVFTIRSFAWFETCRVVITASIWRCSCAGSPAGIVAR